MLGLIFSRGTMNSNLFKFIIEVRRHEFDRSLLFLFAQSYVSCLPVGDLSWITIGWRVSPVKLALAVSQRVLLLRERINVKFLQRRRRAAGQGVLQVSGTRKRKIGNNNIKILWPLVPYPHTRVIFRFRIASDVIQNHWYIFSGFQILNSVSLWLNFVLISKACTRLQLNF